MTVNSKTKLFISTVAIFTGFILVAYNRPEFSQTYQSFKLSVSLYLTKPDFGQFNGTLSKCFMPKLLVDDPSLAHLIKTHSPLVCAKQKNWVYTWDGRLYFNEKIVESNGSINCDYNDIVRDSENDYHTVLYANFANASLVKGDGFKIKCKSSKSGSTYTNVHFTVPELSFDNKNSNATDNDADNTLSTTSSFSTDMKKIKMRKLHVFFYLLDSMSRINFIRKLPEFYSYLTKEMNATVMESFNIVGDGTPWAVIPLTTGHFQYELPEARKRFDNASFLDNWPFIFKDFRRANYGTVFAEEMARFNAYTYKLKGFDKKLPVDHYLRPILQVADGEAKNHKAYCLGDQPKSLMWLDYWQELKHMYEKYDRRTLSILFSAETSHDDYNLVQTLDTHLTTGFKRLFEGALLNDTILFILGDHGRRFGPVRQTQSGKIEEKLPFLAVVTPPWFSEEFPKAVENLHKNRDRLCTVFDLHATLQHVLNYTELDDPNYSQKRGISLFLEIPEYRTCKNADIKPHFCGCLDWQAVENFSDSPHVRKSVSLVLDEMNRWLEKARDKCARLELKEIISANLFKPNDQLMAFKESYDYDNYFPDLSANKKLSSVFYQIRMVTTPGDADWEFTVTYFLEKNEFKFVQENLSRLNRYGNQPNCIINSHHHLREYCYCVNSTMTS